MCDFRVSSILGPVHTYPDILESATFPFRIRPPTTRIRRIGQRIWIFLNPLSRVEKYIRNESDNVWTGESGYFRFRWRGKSVFGLLSNNKPIWLHNSNNRANLPQLSRTLWRMLWAHFIAEEPWVLQWIRISSDACGQVNSPYAACGRGNFWIRKEKVAD